MLDTPVWSVMLYDLSNQPVMDVSRFVEFELGLVLNDNSTFSFSIDLVQFERACAAVNLFPRNVIYPKKTEVRVYRNGVSKFGGIIATAYSMLEENSSTLECTADSYLQYFATRFVNKTYVQTDRSDIAWDAISTVQARTHGNLGVTQGVLAPIFDSDLTCDYRDVKSIIRLYTYAQPTTYDFEITPEKVFNTYEYMGSDRDDYPLTYPGNIVSMGVPRSGDTLFNSILGIGSGIGEERIQTIQEDEISQTEYRIYESKQTFNSVQLQDTLEENTAGYLNEHKKVLVLPKVTINADAIDLDVVSLGDRLPVLVTGSTYNNDVDLKLRIYGMNIKVDDKRNETISLDFYKPDAGGDLE